MKCLFALLSVFLLTSVASGTKMNAFRNTDMNDDVGFDGGRTAQKLYLTLMEAIVNNNMTALNETLTEDMQFVVVGWAQDSQRNPGFCDWRGRDAFVAHVSGFVNLFKNAAAWIDSSFAGYNSLFVNVGFTFSGGPGANNTKNLVFAPMTHQMTQIKKDQDGQFRISRFLEIGSWHSTSGPFGPSPVDTSMVNVFGNMTQAVVNKDIDTLSNIFSEKLEAQVFQAGMPTAPQPANYSSWLKMYNSSLFPQTAASQVNLVSNFASCRFQTAQFVYPRLGTDGIYSTTRGISFTEFDQAGEKIEKIWEGVEVTGIPPPYEIPTKPRNPVNNNN